MQRVFDTCRTFGTYRVPKDKAFTTTLNALRLGYRGIDCAELYRNENFVASALKTFLEESKTDRNEIFLTTKIRKFTPENVNDRIKIFGEIDCLLVHFPTEDFVDNWIALNNYVRDNNLPIRFLGVSNFKVCHLQSLIDSKAPIPYCNQIEASPFWNRDDIATFCKNIGVKITAHSPLVKSEKKEHPILSSIAEKYKCSWAQVLIAYSLQKEFVPIVRSCDVEHLKENLSFPTLDWTDMNILDGLDEQYATHIQYK